VQKTIGNDVKIITTILDLSPIITTIFFEHENREKRFFFEQDLSLAESDQMNF